MEVAIAWETSLRVQTRSERNSLTFQNNRISLLIGPSGSGKSTLLSIIGGMDIQNHGTLCFNGKKITKKNIDSYRNTNIGFVFQDMNLITSFTLRENLRLAFDLCGKKMTDTETARLLFSVGLPDDNVSLHEFLARKTILQRSMKVMKKV